MFWLQRKGAPDASLERWEQFLTQVKQYLAIKTWISLATGIILDTWLAILGIDYPLQCGLLAFALNYVPNIGTIIAAAPALLLALVQVGAIKTLAAAGGYVVVNLIMGNAVEPRHMGRGLGLSTLVVFLSLLFWGWVSGLVGMLLSLPLTITAKIALDSRPETSWLAILLGPKRRCISSRQTMTAAILRLRWVRFHDIAQINAIALPINCYYQVCLVYTAPHRWCCDANGQRQPRYRLGCRYLGWRI